MSQDKRRRRKKGAKVQPNLELPPPGLSKSQRKAWNRRKRKEGHRRYAAGLTFNKTAEELQAEAGIVSVKPWDCDHKLQVGERCPKCNTIRVE